MPIPIPSTEAEDGPDICLPSVGQTHARVGPAAPSCLPSAPTARRSGCNGRPAFYEHACPICGAGPRERCNGGRVVPRQNRP